MELNVNNTVKKKTEDYIKQLNNIQELNNYNISILIEPKEKETIVPTGYIDSEDVKNWVSQTKESNSFLIYRIPNGCIYNYKGMLAITVK